jgi:hypothetical protein
MGPEFELSFERAFIMSFYRWNSLTRKGLSGSLCAVAQDADPMMIKVESHNDSLGDVSPEFHHLFPDRIIIFRRTDRKMYWARFQRQQITCCGDKSWTIFWISMTWCVNVAITQPINAQWKEFPCASQNQRDALRKWILIITALILTLWKQLSRWSRISVEIISWLIRIESRLF